MVVNLWTWYAKDAERSKVGTVGGSNTQIFWGIFPDPLPSVYEDIWKQNPSGMRCWFSRILSVYVMYTGISPHWIVPYLYAFSLPHQTVCCYLLGLTSVYEAIAPIVYMITLVLVSKMIASENAMGVSKLVVCTIMKQSVCLFLFWKGERKSVIFDGVDKA